MEVSGQLALAALPPGKGTPVSIGLEVGWASEPVLTRWRRESPWPYRESNTGRPARSL